jgi:hypothetical protein
MFEMQEFHGNDRNENETKMKRRFFYKSYDLYHIVISTRGKNLQGCRKYPHQPRFLALLGMTTG